jgi:hypothetical protein
MMRLASAFDIITVEISTENGKMDRVGTTNESGVNISSIFRGRGVRGWRIAGVRGDGFASIEKKNLNECGIFHHPTNQSSALYWRC